MKARVVTLDVREDIRTGRSPCGRIMAAVAGLRPGEVLRLLVPFEPVPLYQVLGQQGFAHVTQTLPGGDFEVLFTPAKEARDEAHLPRHKDGGSPGQGRCGPTHNLREPHPGRLSRPNP